MKTNREKRIRKLDGVNQPTCYDKAGTDRFFEDHSKTNGNGEPVRPVTQDEFEIFIAPASNKVHKNDEQTDHAY